jgi:hypothetical protein
MVHKKDLKKETSGYTRNPDDYEWLCRACHMKKDGRAKTFWVNGPKTSALTSASRRKLTNKQVQVIKWAHHYGTPKPFLAKMFKVSNWTIYACFSRYVPQDQEPPDNL